MGSLVKSAIVKLFGSSVVVDDGWKVYATAHVQRRQLLDIVDIPGADPSDVLSELLGNQLSLRLVSQDVIDPVSGYGKVSEVVFLEDWLDKKGPISADGCASYCANFRLQKGFGVPAALLVVNHNPNDFRLNYVVLHLPDDTTIHFSCNSWIYHYSNYDGPRIFFTNQACLPNDTPAGIKKLRSQDLQYLRGDGTGKRHFEDRIYDYDVYNDLGDPDLGEDFKRNILGGSNEYPYPRRCRTGRNRTITGQKSIISVHSLSVTRDCIIHHMIG